MTCHRASRVRRIAELLSVEVRATLHIDQSWGTRNRRIFLDVFAQ